MDDTQVSKLKGFKTIYRFRLRRPDGVILAKCPFRTSGLKTAFAMFGTLNLRIQNRTWNLLDNSGNVLAIIE
jgi:hypothetical protein